MFKMNYPNPILEFKPYIHWSSFRFRHRRGRREAQSHQTAFRITGGPVCEGMHSAIIAGKLRVLLWTYGQRFNNAPSGVLYRDANQWLPWQAAKPLLNRGWPCALLADFVRWRAAHAEGGWVVDGDTLWLRPAPIPQQGPPSLAHAFASCPAFRDTRCGGEKMNEKWSVLIYLARLGVVEYFATPFLVPRGSPLLEEAIVAVGSLWTPLLEVVPCVGTVWLPAFAAPTTETWQAWESLGPTLKLGQRPTGDRPPDYNAFMQLIRVLITKHGLGGACLPIAGVSAGLLLALARRDLHEAADSLPRGSLGKSRARAYLARLVQGERVLAVRSKCQDASDF